MSNIRIIHNQLRTTRTTAVARIYIQQQLYTARPTDSSAVLRAIDTEVFHLKVALAVPCPRTRRHAPLCACTRDESKTTAAKTPFARTSIIHSFTESTYSRFFFVRFSFETSSSQNKQAASIFAVSYSSSNLYLVCFSSYRQKKKYYSYSYCSCSRIAPQTTVAVSARRSNTPAPRK